MKNLSTFNLNIYGIKFRIKTLSSRVEYIRMIFRLFPDENFSKHAEEIEWLDGSELDLTLPLARHGIFCLHAGAFVNKKGVGVIVPGGAGSGKSTLVFFALRSGLKIVGDDVILCRRSGDKIQLLPYTSQMVLKRNNKHIIYDVLEHYPQDVFSDISPGKVVFPLITDNEKSSMEVIRGKKEKILRLIGSIGWIDDKSIREEEISILKELSFIPSYNLILGKDHNRRPELALEILEKV